MPCPTWAHHTIPWSSQAAQLSQLPSGSSPACQTVPSFPRIKRCVRQLYVQLLTAKPEPDESTLTVWYWAMTWGKMHSCALTDCTLTMLCCTAAPRRAAWLRHAHPHSSYVGTTQQICAQKHGRMCVGCLGRHVVDGIPCTRPQPWPKHAIT